MKTKDIIEAFEKFTATGDKSNGILIVDERGGNSFNIRTTNSSYYDLVTLLLNATATMIKRADKREITISILADIYTSVGLKNSDEDVREFLHVLDTIQNSPVDTETSTVQ